LAFYENASQNPQDEVQNPEQQGMAEGQFHSAELNSLAFYENPSQNPLENPQDKVQNPEQQGMPEGQFHSPELNEDFFQIPKC
jgi:hypothetical protein